MPARDRSWKKPPGRRRRHSAPGFRPRCRECPRGIRCRHSHRPLFAGRSGPNLRRPRPDRCARSTILRFRRAEMPLRPMCSTRPLKPASATSRLLPPPSTNSGIPFSRAHAAASAISSSSCACDEPPRRTADSQRRKWRKRLVFFKEHRCKATPRPARATWCNRMQTVRWITFFCRMETGNGLTASLPEVTCIQKSW